MQNTLKKKLGNGESAIGAWISSGSPNLVDLLRKLNFDWFVFDMEHSAISIETVGRMIQVLNGSTITPLVRVGQIDQAVLKVVLDSGAQGVVVPLVNTVEEAERAVRFCKYPPQGVRGVAATKASDYGMSLSNYIRTANEETAIIAQIETPQAVDNIKEILSVKGVDVAFVGPSDLTMTMGLMDDRSNPKVTEAMLKVLKACQDAGKTAGTMATSLDETKFAVQRGFRFISLASEMRFATMGARAFLEAAGRQS
ncbi:MAG: aldolase/citrate lyase family protein [Thaumarchaeota archaeon]|nr:aldolase/citrate lyase family protein [Nitrososphaerota archaeon]